MQSSQFWSVNAQLIPATAAEISKIRELAHSIWHEYYPSIIGLDQVEYMLKKMYSEQAMAEQMQNGQQFYLLNANESNCGFLAVSKEGEGRYFLNKFYILSNVRRTGLGKAAFALLLEKYPDLRELRLQVNRQNVVAINFYFKAGFVIEKSADFDIGDGYFMNDFIMCFTRK